MDLSRVYGAMECQSAHTDPAAEPVRAAILPRLWPPALPHPGDHDQSVEPHIPEPSRLYALVVLTFVTHVPYVNVDTCVQCQKAWPCEQARLAYRLREGF
jgi:hypothetical protein